jgi:hypothetical protein
MNSLKLKQIRHIKSISGKVLGVYENGHNFQLSAEVSEKETDNRT